MKETEAEELREDNPAELQEGAPMQDDSESRKITGQAKKTGTKELNVSEPEEPSKEELEVTEKEELTLYVSDEP